MSEEENNPTSKSQAEHLEKLFEFVTPRGLRKSVMSAFFIYLLEQDRRGLDGGLSIDDWEFLDCQACKNRQFNGLIQVGKCGK